MPASSSRPNSAPKNSDLGKALPARTVADIDSWYQTAGLVRSRRDKPAGIRARAVFDEKVPEDLRPKPAKPVKAANGVELVRVPGWETFPWLWHGFATRRGGVSTAYAHHGPPGELNLGFTPDDDRSHVLHNRELLVEAVTGNPKTPLLLLRQIHSGVVHSAGPGSVCRIDGPCRGDGMITSEPGVLLGVQTADCTPVLVADRRRKVIAAFHAGWRGTVRRIVENGVGRMRLEFGSHPEDMVAAIGPSIGACCYAVGEEVISEFESQFAYARELFHEVYDTDPVRQKYPMLFLTQRAPGHSPIGPGTHLDVAEANRCQLLDAGLKASAISMVGGCTRCQPDLFFSHRGSQGRCGRMLSVIGIHG